MLLWVQKSCEGGQKDKIITIYAVTSAFYAIPIIFPIFTTNNSTSI